MTAGRRHSLRGRLLAAVLGASALAWLLAIAVVVGVAWYEAGEVYDQALEEGSRLVLALGTADAGAAGHSRPRAAADALRLELHYQLLRDGRVLRRAEEAPAQPFVDPAQALDGKGDGKGDRHADVWVQGRLWRVHVRSDRASGLQAQVGQPWRERVELIEDAAERLAWPALALWLLLGLGCWWLIRRLLAPLERTAAGIGAKTPQDLSPVPLDGQPRELLPIVDALNGLLARLGGALAAERRFTADAAHELRTPLAALRTRVQLIERRLALPAPELQGLRDDVDRCTRLLQSLLALARLDPAGAATAPPLACEAVDLAALLADLDPQAAEARGMQVHRRTEAPTLWAEPALLATALRNLLDNAVRYSRAGGRIDISAVPRADGGVRLQVADDGPGVEPAARARLGERFFRVLGSGQPGSGLGLSIVARIAALHGATLSFDDGPGGRGLAVRLDFPPR